MIRDYTKSLSCVEFMNNFLRRKEAKYLPVNFSWQVKKGCEFHGYYYVDEVRIGCYLNRKMKLPLVLEFIFKDKKRQKFYLRTLDEVAVYVFGHEMWHYFYRTRRINNNTEGMATYFGTRLVLEYRKYRKKMVLQK